MSPTQRSLKLLREQGYKPWIVEHWNHCWKVQVHGWGKLKDGWQVKIIELN